MNSAAGICRPFSQSVVRRSCQLSTGARVSPSGRQQTTLERWVASLRRLGIVQPANSVVDFDLKNYSMICNCYGVEGRPMSIVEFGDIPADSNLRPVLPTMQKINISTRVPRYLQFLARDLAGDSVLP